MDEVTLQSLKETIESILKKCHVGTPIYGNLKRQLAELLFESNDSLDGIVHLVESLGGKYKMEHAILEQEYELSGGASNENHIKNLDVVKVFNSIPLQYSSSEAFLKDLNSLPSEWTLIQITRKPQCKDILQVVRQHMAGQLDFSLDRTRLVVMTAGQDILQIQLNSPSSGDHMKTFFDLVNEALGKMTSASNSRNRREEASVLMKDVSKGIEDSWLCEYQCLLPGHLKCPHLNALIQTTLESIRSSLVTMTTSMETFLRRLLQGVHLISEHQVNELILGHVTNGDELLAEFVTQAVVKFKNEHSKALSTAARYPVILILEEELDRLPWETILCLRSSPVTRVHCFQFLLALVKLHTAKHGPIKNGYLTLPLPNHETDTFVIMNPSCDLPALQTKFTTFLDKKFDKWKHIIGRAPSSSEFSDGLSSHSVFIYAGHGNGTLYLSSDNIGRNRIRAVTFLFGCRSVERVYHGGRVPFSGVGAKYFIAGSPCVVGNLWNVSSSDCDRLASNLINLTFPSPRPSPPILDLHKFSSEWWSVPFVLPVPNNSTLNAVNGALNCENENLNVVNAALKSNGSPIRNVNGSLNGQSKVTSIGSCTISKDPNSKSSTVSNLKAPSMVRKGRAKSSKKPSVVDSNLILKDWVQDSYLHSSKDPGTETSLSYSPDVCFNVQAARQGANYFINSSALVVWGLPVWFE
uniref:separase n=1 Tax=Cacopsylla melanoneura TaxID=428564 RepID=A0A8D8QZJ6_9HEMI